MSNEELKQERIVLNGQKKILLEEKEKLETALHDLPAERADLERELATTDVLSLGYERFESLQKKKFFFEDRKGRLEEALGENAQRLDDINDKISRNMKLQTVFLTNELQEDWQAERKKFLRLVALSKIRTGAYNPILVLWQIFSLHLPSTKVELDKIFRSLVDQLERTDG